MQHAPPSNGLAVFARIFWMALGPGTLFVLLFTIASKSNGWLKPQDAIYFLVLIALIVARRFEFNKGSGQTAQGAPATQADIRRYSLAASILGCFAWGVANFIGNYGLS